MSTPPKPHPATLAAQALGFVDAETKAVVPPLHIQQDVKEIPKIIPKF